MLGCKELGQCPRLTWGSAPTSAFNNCETDDKLLKQLSFLIYDTVRIITSHRFLINFVIIYAKDLPRFLPQSKCSVKSTYYHLVSSAVVHLEVTLWLSISVEKESSG